MTTVIVVVVVALVFFVTLCTVTFMVWKREEEMRTDSLRSIESNLQELGYRMTGDFSKSARGRYITYQGDADENTVQTRRGRNEDPFEWTRENAAVASIRDDASQMDDDFEGYEAGEQARQIDVSGAPDDIHAKDMASAASRQIDSELNAYQDMYAKLGEEREHAPESVLDVDSKGLTQSQDIIPPQPDIDMEAAKSEDDFMDDQFIEEFFEDESDGEDDVENTFIDEEDFAILDDEPNAEPEEEDYPEIELSDIPQLKNDEDAFDSDMINIEDFKALDDMDSDMDTYVADYLSEDMANDKAPMSGDIGRSGRKYTAEELDMLIKE